MALGHLRTLAEQTAVPLTGDSPDAIASGYVKSGYRRMMRVASAGERKE